MVKLNVEEVLKKKNKTKYWLFNELNNIAPMSYTNFHNMIANKTKSIKFGNLEKLWKILEVEPNDLLKKF